MTTSPHENTNRAAGADAAPLGAADALTPDLIRRVLVAVQFDNNDSIWWRLRDTQDPTSSLDMYVFCSDFFAYACADVEPIESADDVTMFEAACAAADAADTSYSMWGPLLYAARHRRTAPLPAALRSAPAPIVELFNQIVTQP